jgi:hypothetical protein
MVNYHTYPSGTTVIKAFIANDFIFYNERKRIIKELNKDSFQQARFVKIIWRIQKNCQNGKSITLAAESDRPKICPVRSAMQLVLCVRWLNQPDDMPIALYKTKKGKVRARIFTSLVTKLPSFSGRPSKKYAPTLLLTKSSGTLLIPCGSGLAYCLMRQKSFRIISRKCSTSQRIASCFAGGYRPNRCFAKGGYCPVYYKGGNRRSRHAQICR